MTETRQDVAMKLTKANLFSDQVKRQIKVTEEKIVDLNSKIDQEIESSGDSQLIPDLIATREQLTHLQVSLEIGAKKQREAQAQLDDWDRAAKGGKIQALDKQLQAAVVNLQSLVGEGGLKGELDKLGSLIAELEHSSIADVKIMDVDQHVHSARSIHLQLSQSLLETWQAVEGLRWGPVHSTDSSRPNYLPGFGVRPGNLIS